MRVVWSIAMAATLGLAAGPTAAAQQARAHTVQPAIDGALAALKTHSLVGVNDAHGLAQEADFYAALICDPRFAPDVGNVVLEDMTALHQSIADQPWFKGDREHGVWPGNPPTMRSDVVEQLCADCCASPWRDSHSPGGGNTGRCENFRRVTTLRTSRSRKACRTSAAVITRAPKAAN